MLSIVSDKATFIFSALSDCETSPNSGGITHIDQVVPCGCVIVPWLKVQNHKKTSRSSVLPILHRYFGWCLEAFSCSALRMIGLAV